MIFQCVLNNAGVLTLNHENRFFDLDAVRFIRKDRKGVEPKLLEVTKALWMNHAGITIGGEIEWLTIDEQGLFQLGQQDISPNSRLGGSHKTTVVRSEEHTPAPK